MCEKYLAKYETGNVLNIYVCMYVCRERGERERGRERGREREKERERERESFLTNKHSMIFSKYSTKMISGFKIMLNFVLVRESCYF